MALHPAEEATIRAFVVAAKRDRLLTLLGSSKRRRKALDALNHFAGWDSRDTQAVKSSDVLAVLQNAGAPSDCHVISDASDLDGRDMPLVDAVSACEAYSVASVLVVCPVNSPSITTRLQCRAIAWFFGDLAFIAFLEP